MNYLIILLAHLYADSHLQGSHISKYKCDTQYMMALHCAMYSLVMTLTLYYTLHIGIWSLPVLFLSHWYIDHQAKCQGKLNDWWDLSLHLTVVALIIGIK